MDSVSFEQVKTDIHRELLAQLDLEKLARTTNGQAKQAVASIIQGIVAKERLLLNSTEKEKIQSDLLDEVFGLGPLEPLLKDQSVSDILINRNNLCYIERNGLLERIELKFRDDNHLLQIIDRIIGAVGRRIDESSPMVDARLADGSRVNAIIPPLALDGPALSIRRFGVAPLTAERLLELKSISPAMLTTLQAAVKARISILISGGTGAGKTTFLNMLSKYIPPGERLITIEDAAELQIQQENVVRLETRPPNVEGQGAVRQRQLLINSLRMRPDRIIIGEVRGEEAFDMLQAMNTGHDGSLATIHANTPRDALARLENMIGMAGLNLPPKAARQQIASAITAVVQIARLSDGKRKVMSLSEITGMEGDIITMQEIFSFRQTGVSNEGAVQGYFSAAGVRPKFIERLRSHGVTIPDSLFDPTKQYL